MVLWLVAIASGAEIHPDTFADGLEPDGRCSLREAVLAANTDEAVDSCAAGDGDDVILLGQGVYAFAGAISREDEALVQIGDLDVIGSLQIAGRGMANTVVDAEQIDRVFDVHPDATLTLRDLAVVGGLPAPFAIDELDELTPKPLPASGGGIRNQGALVLDSVEVADNATPPGDTFLMSNKCVVLSFGRTGNMKPSAEERLGGAARVLHA